MAKIEFKGIEAYQKAMAAFSRDTRDVMIGGAIYDAAGIVADEIQDGISSIPTLSHFERAADGKTVNGLLAKQKADLHNSLGIAKLRDDNGFVSVKIGWDGYNSIRTARWPNGQPNQMIARSLERGTSWLQAFPFVKKAVSRARKRAIEAMQERIDRACEEYFNKSA